MPAMKHHYVLLLAFLSIPSALDAQTCANYHVSVSPDGGTLYYSSNRDGNYDIYRSGLDGFSDLQRIADLPGDAYAPSVSPDGSKVVFQAGAYGAEAEIWIVNSDGTGLTRLTNNGVHDGQPNFSPDGSKIIFEAWDGTPYPEVFTMNVDGSGRTQITNEPGAYWQSGPRYSPAGDKIYFLAGFNADNHIVMMDLDGSNWVDITPPNNFGYMEGSPSFSPDGQQILFYTSEITGYANGGDLVIANADGSNWQFITASQGGEYFAQAVYHPTNGLIYFSHLPPGGAPWNIWSMNTDGTDKEEVGTCFGVGIAETERTLSLTLAPNPARDQVTVGWGHASGAVQEVVLTDLLGKVLLWWNAPRTDRLVLDTQQIAEGVYLVQLRGNGHTVTERLVIAR